MRLPFGAYLKKLRQQHKLTLREVAATIDIDQSSLAKIEKSKMIAPQYIIKPVAALFEIEFKDMQISYLRDKWVRTYAQVPFALEALEETLVTMQAQKDALSSAESTMISQRLATYFSDRPVQRVWLFGSAVRDDLTVDSDIDLLIRFEEGHNLDLFDYMNMTDDIEQLIERPVDLVVEGQLDELIVDTVEAEKQLIYEQA